MCDISGQKIFASAHMQMLGVEHTKIGGAERRSVRISAVLRRCGASHTPLEKTAPSANGVLTRYGNSGLWDPPELTLALG